MTVLVNPEQYSPEELREISRAINPRSVSAKKARQNGKRARRRPEDDLQRTVCEHLDLLQRTGRLLYFHVPNGGKRNVIEAMKFKWLGVKAGVPDLVIIPRVGPVCFIELKSEDGTLQETQKFWLQALPDYGCPVAVCRSLDDVQQFLYRTGVIREVA